MDHPTMTALMIASAIAAVTCCLAAGRAVPWQGRQAVIVMAIAMVASAASAGDSRIALLAGTALMLSAMLGTAGLRGRPVVRTCCHRALGSLVMAVCMFTGISHGEMIAEAGHGMHSGTDAVGVLAAFGVVALAAWTVADRIRPHGGTSRLVVVETWVMTASVVIMWLAH
ncbi:hypothetical protein [Microbacterium sp. LWO13-1.2]|uniref:hypothetical protein n=1 Tax=Microbacterium sp. LWO13-1.2 TaxID=3135262 RepID=UPI0031394680